MKDTQTLTRNSELLTRTPYTRSSWSIYTVYDDHALQRHIIYCVTSPQTYPVEHHELDNNTSQNLKQIIPVTSRLDIQNLDSLFTVFVISFFDSYI